MARLLLDIIICLFYSIACIGMGELFVRLSLRKTCNAGNATSITYLSSSFVIGICILSAIWFIMLCVGEFNRPLILLVLIFSGAAGAQTIWCHRQRIKPQLHQLLNDFSMENKIFQLIIILGMMIVLMVGGMTFRPLSPQGDAAAFYLTLPKLFAAAKHLTFLPGYEYFQTFGLFGEYHFAALIALGCNINAKLIVFPLAIAGAIVLAAFTRLLGGGRQSQWIALIMLYSSTAVTLLIGDGKVDLFAAIIGLTTFYLLCSNCYNSLKFKHFVCGLLAGFSVVSKLSYAPMILAGMLVLIFVLREKTTSKKELLSHLILFLVAFSLPVFLHLIKNWILIKEPFSPFYFLHENPFVSSWADVNKNWFSDNVIRKIILTYPIAMVFGSYPMQYGNISFMVLAFLPLMFCIYKELVFKRKMLLIISTIGIFSIAIWAVIRPSMLAPRYFLYAPLILIPLAAYSIERVISKDYSPNWFKKIMTWYCLFAVLIGCYANLRYSYNGFRHLVRSVGIASNKESNLEKVSNILNSLVSQDEGRVFNLNYFTFWYNPDALINMSTSWEVDAVKKIYNSNQEAINYLINHKFRYILLNKKSHSAWVEILKTWESREQNNLKTIFEGNEFNIYAL